MVIVARKTIKGLEEIIEDLEKRLNEQNKINVELHNQISQMQMIADDKFENSPMYRRMNSEIEELKSNNVVNKLKNERGAGRKEMFTEEQKARVKMLRLQGKSYRAIANEMNCSVATVHKIINEQ